jgi:transposase, IS5 family
MSMKTYQPGFFDLETRVNQLTEMGDSLVDLKLRIDWEAFRIDLSKVHEKKRKSNAGAKPISTCAKPIWYNIGVQPLV